MIIFEAEVIDGDGSRDGNLLASTVEVAKAAAEEIVSDYYGLPVEWKEHKDKAGWTGLFNDGPRSIGTIYVVPRKVIKPAPEEKK